MSLSTLSISVSNFDSVSVSFYNLTANTTLYPADLKMFTTMRTAHCECRLAKFLPCDCCMHTTYLAVSCLSLFPHPSMGLSVSIYNTSHLNFDRDGNIEFYTHPWCAQHAKNNQKLDFIRTVSFLPDLITKKLAAIALYAIKGEEM